MPTQNRVPLSVRIDQEDYDFIAQLHIEGANTPSEKVRELLKQARLAHAQAQDYEHGLDSMERFIQAAKRHVLHAEKEWGIHSTILARLFEQVPDLAATLAADLPEHATQQDLLDYEREMMWRVVRLMDAVLQLAVVGKGAAYDDNILLELDNTLKLANIVQQARS
ncbi:hypothetical protein [Alysiella filiformis]|uniref:Uncharacterized protein n=1 Tax=Alysiella filiformis DSM 16848 TaxID=1120981 RepID=A0A286E4C2_9NEIS|nr:hypothetical protein [Alysiella filiformis]QMT31002.1 hypothetical protein H3L97_09775 [Alysiella filiformis]UBQ56010.1 hypothetical protein JF568_10695 [Alysiella filiformis DSM 16848]SOD65711.1 hypothetical protein SAMN02746062_00395 [Alysiella filiformis DSM 16848]